MKIDKGFLLLTVCLITVSPALGQRDTVFFPDLPNDASVDRSMRSSPISPWRKPYVTHQSHMTHIPTDGLVGYWPFNGNAHDESGNGNNGTVFGDAALTEDRFDNPNSAYLFDGVDDYISVGDSSILDMDTSMSMMAWIKPDFVHTDRYNSTIINKEGEYEFARYIEDDEIRYAITNSYPGWYWVPSGYEAPPDEWSHVAIVYDEGLTTVYVNGGAYFAFSGSGTIGDDSPGYNELWFGNRSGEGNQRFHGVIDDIRIYNRALSEEEVVDIYNEIPNDPLAQPGVCYGSTGSSEPTYPGALITIDPLTGDGKLVGLTGIIGDEGPSVPALAVRSNGEMYALSWKINAELYQINASTGYATLIAATGLAHSSALSFDLDDQLFAIDENDILFSVDEATGMTTVIGATGAEMGGLACDPTSGVMYASDHEDSIFTVDVLSGKATLVGTTGLGGNTPDINFDQNGNLFGTKREPNGMYDFITIDKVTGIGTIIGPIGFTGVIGLASRLADSHVADIHESPEMPASTTLLANYPNPFNPSTTIRYALSENAQVTLAVHNVLGQLVATLVDETQSPGYRSVVWNGKSDTGSNVASGIYFYRITTGGFTITKRMLLLK